MPLKIDAYTGFKEVLLALRRSGPKTVPEFYLLFDSSALGTTIKIFIKITEK
jgi:hypothetical protein